MTTYSELLSIRDRLTVESTPSDAELAELAAKLPFSLDGRPESALVLAGLYERLRPYRREPRWPAWRAAQLPMRVQIAWLLAEILNEPAVVGTEPRGELLYQALRQVRVTRVLRPEELVAESAASDDPVLQGEALRLAEDGLHAACLSPALVRKHIVSLLSSGNDDVVIAALEKLAEPWAALSPLPAERFAGFLAQEPAAGNPKLMSAALVAASCHGHADTLREVVAEPERPSFLRRHAMQLLGDLVDRSHLPELVAIAAQDPLMFGGPLAACLRGLHRRGHFLADQEVPALLGIALADHTISAEEIATILFVNRQAMFRTLIDAAPDDPSWPRRLELLVALEDQGRGEVPVGEAITRLLPSASRPEPLLAAIRTLRYRDAEEAVIAILPSAPAAALSALEAIGARRTVTALRAGLGLVAEGDTLMPHLRADRNQALEILWHLTRDLGERHALLDRLDPTDLPPRIASDLGGPDEREMALLRSHLDPEKPVAALCRLAACGSAGTVPVVADLLLRIVAELAAWGQPGSPEWRLDSELQTGEPVVPQEVADAIRGMGRRLHARRKIRPVCLLDAETPNAAGDALVASMALDLLDRPEISAAEHAILLELLVRVPSTRTRGRVQRLLRHPDRHVRKHAIALVASTASGGEAQALSATLIKLTTAQDVQTVRQTLLALGQADARWAAVAVAACLDHPAMNIKKTAAETLAAAGSPAAVPKLLFWLGHHGNPGLRASLVEALRSILGSAYAATLISVAETESDERARRLLLAGLDDVLTASELLRLSDQDSVAVPTLLTLVAEGEIVLLWGSRDELGAAFDRHGVARPVPERPLPSAEADEAVRALLVAKWDATIALRIAETPELPQAVVARRLRPRLADWLRLAASAPVVRGRLPELFPAAWSPADLAAFAAFVPVLIDGLAEADDEHRGWFISVLAGVASGLSAVEKLAVVDAVRALPPMDSSVATDSDLPTGDSTLLVLRRCDAVLLRVDVEQALAAAGQAPDPVPAQAAVLRGVFTGMRADSQDPDTRSDPESVETAEAWRVELTAAIRTRGAVEVLRQRTAGLPASQFRLEALIDVFAAAGTEVRGALLDWMLAIQPLDAPSWTIAETAADPVTPPRIPREDDLDRPRSAAQRDRLLAMLASPDRERRDVAARALAHWPELDIRLAVLRPYLRGDIDERAGGDLARAVRTLCETELRADGVLPARVLLAAGQPLPGDAEVLVPLLLEWWQQGSPTDRRNAETFLRRFDPNTLAESVGSRLEAGEWGFAQLLSGRELLRTPSLTKLCEHLRLDGRTALADSIDLVDGPLRGPDAKQNDAAALTALRDPSQVPKPTEELSRAGLFDLARSGRPEQIRRALRRLTETQDSPTTDPDVADLLAELLVHPKPQIRLLAHRTGRQLLDRPTYLRHTSILLADPSPDVLRTAIRTLSHAAWEPAIPAIVPLLEHPQATVRAEATSGLIRFGQSAVGALRYAADHARPDRRFGYIAVLMEIADLSD